MRTHGLKVTSILGFGALAVGWAGTAHAQPWFSLKSAPTAGASFTGPVTNSVAGDSAVLDTCELLTDGTVMCHEFGTNHWHRLSPDPTAGTYVNGRWDVMNDPTIPPPIPDMPMGNDVHTGFSCVNCPYAPLYFGSAVLKDGQVVVIGGEDMNVSGGLGAETNIGFLYNPVTNVWSKQLNEAFGGGNQGDNSSVVLQDGTFLLAEVGGLSVTAANPLGFENVTNMESFDETMRSFTALNPTGKRDGNAEEGWNILPNNTVLTVDTQLASSFEIYAPSPTNSWGNGGSTTVNLVSNTPGVDTTNIPAFEVGPAVLRADGNLVYFSGSPRGQNALYNTATGLWSATANFPTTTSTATSTVTGDGTTCPGLAAQTVSFSVKDGPASLLPNGNVLVLASPTVNESCEYQRSSQFFEFQFSNDPMINNTLIPAPTNTNGSQPTQNIGSYEGRMLVLPTGEILFTDDVGDIFIWNDNEVPQDAWRPAITTVPSSVSAGMTFPVSGSLFNGFSQGAFYGDDAQMATNYPLVRIASGGQVFYARTHDHSRMGVEAVGDPEVVTTQFDVPMNLPGGPCTLEVVANGIASAPASITCIGNQPPVASCQNFTTSANASCQGTATAANINNGSSSPAGDPLTFSLSPAGPFPLGTTNVTLTVTDPTEGTSSSCMATVTVVNDTPPVLTVPPNVTVTSCTGSATVQVGEATAADNCATGLVPTGAVIAANGVPLVPPIPVVGGQVTLGVGTFTIQWTVSQGANTSTANQTVVVGAGIEASDSFLVDDRAQVQNSSGGFASVLNSGPGATQIGNGARTGSVLSVGPIDILHQAVVTGSVESASTVMKDSDATVTGATTMHGTVALPALPTLPAFPAPAGGPLTVNSGTTRSLAPGSYTQGMVNGGALILAAGSYFFQSLTLNSGSTVRAIPTTEIFVENTLVFNAPIRATSGTALQPVLLGFAGQNLSLTAQFNGTLIAPNADVDFGTGSGVTYTGSFFGRILEITPASVLVCNTGIAPETPLSLELREPIGIGTGASPAAGSAGGCSLATASSNGGWPAGAWGGLGIVGAALTRLRRRRSRTTAS